MKGSAQTLPKDMKSLLRLAKEQGWEVTRTTGGHPRCISPKGDVVVGSGTTSDMNSIWDFRARLKKAGLLPFVEVTKPAHVKKEEPVSIHSTPAAVVVSGEKKKKTYTPGIRGNLRTALIDLLRAQDKPEGLTAQQAYDKLKETMPGLSLHSVASSLRYYAGKDGTFTKVKHGMFRLTSCMNPAAALPAAPAEEDDEKVLIEFLVMLDKVGNIVKRHVELHKALAGVMQKLGTNK